MKEKAVCGDLFQLAEFARLATPLARFGKVDRAATNQKVGSSNPPGRTIFLNNLRSTQFAGICRVSVNCPCSDATAMDSLGHSTADSQLEPSGNTQQPREFTPADHSSSSGGLCPLLPTSIIFGGRGISTTTTLIPNCAASLGSRGA
jgi:hypothetical protein